jgi:hypothetical protein
MKTKPMTLERLGQYRSLVAEITELQHQIAEQRKTKYTDTVKGSLPEYPYTETSITICGYSPIIVSKLSRRQARLIQERINIETYISNIDDSFTRRVITMRFIQGISWKCLGKKIAGNTSDSLRMLVTRHVQGF